MSDLAFVAQNVSGGDDRSFIVRTREWLRDKPRWVNEQATGTGSTVQFPLSAFPVNDDQFFQITVGGVLVPWTADYSLLNPNNVYVDFDTGMVIFGTPPPAGQQNNVQFTKRVVRWRDSQIRFALLDGLKRAFPLIWQERIIDGSSATPIRLAVNQWDYNLPADFTDPRVQIISVEAQEVGGPTPFRQSILAERVNNTTLHIYNAQAYSPGSLLRIVYAAPYTRLADVDPVVGSTPIWYAAAMLIGGLEAKRGIIDNQTVAAGNSANPAGYDQQSATWFMQQFNADCQRFGRPIPRRMRMVPTYARQ